VHLLLATLLAVSGASAVQPVVLTPVTVNRPTLLTTISTSPAESRQAIPVKVINTKTVTISNAPQPLQLSAGSSPLQLSAAATPLVSVPPTAERPKRSGNIFGLLSNVKSSFGGGLGSLTQISSSPLALNQGNAGTSDSASVGYTYGAPAAGGNGPTYSSYYSQPAVNSLPTVSLFLSCVLHAFNKILVSDSTLEYPFRGVRFIL